MDRNGGLGVDRTHDLRIMRATLTTWLSYKSFERFLSTNMVPMGIEPMAVCLIIVRI